ncbi:MAG: D-alanyl-D-alanine carboxypeptidase family protein [Alphaproteobacteria bacterium]
MVKHLGFIIVSCIFATAALSAPQPAQAGQKAAATSEFKIAKASTKKRSSKKRAATQPRSNPANDAALVVDADTGRVLYEKNAGATRYPASLTKMMTLYLTFDALKKGKLSLNQQIAVSKKAAAQPATNIKLSVGDRISVEKAIESLVVRSANDSAIVLAEAIGKTEWNFALMMTNKARELGMQSTVFRNPHGLPDDKQYTTAYDMARLAIALRRDFPSYYPYFSLQEMSYNGVNYTSHNKVLKIYPGVDGLKTGYIRASGFNLVTSAKRHGFNLVAVVMGGDSAKERDSEMVGLLDRTFARLNAQKKTIAQHSSYNNTLQSHAIGAVSDGAGKAAVAYSGITN